MPASDGEAIVLTQDARARAVIHAAERWSEVRAGYLSIPGDRDDADLLLDDAEQRYQEVERHFHRVRRNYLRHQSR